MTRARYEVHVRVTWPRRSERRQHGPGLVIASFPRPRLVPVWWAARRRARQIGRRMGARGSVEKVRPLPDRRGHTR